MTASARSGAIGGIEMRPAASGWIPARKKNTWAATQSESAGAATLKPTRTGDILLRSESTRESMAMAAVAGAGPKSIAAAMKNVSATEMLASTEATLIVSEPARMPRTANSIHSYPRPGCTARTSESTATALPAAITKRTYHERASRRITLLRVGRGQGRVFARAPDDLIVVVGAPDDVLTVFIGNRRAPDDLIVVIHSGREPAVHHRVRLEPRQGIREAN